MKRSLALLLLLLTSSTAAAEELHVNRTVSVSFSLAGGAAWALSEGLFKDELAPDACHWCDDNAVDRSVRDALLWDDPETAQALSNVSGFMVAPAVAFGMLGLAAWHDDRTGEIVDDELIVLEAVIGTTLVNQGVKFLVGRERPFVHALPAGEKGDTDQPADNNLSFFSGHSSYTFALAVASGTVASLRGYRAAPWIWASGLTVASATAYLRIAGDKHYLSDVLTGAAFGSFVGFAVPYWLHRGEGGESASVGAAWSRGPMLSVSGSF
jgi:membrane-associated phospholipid phosphatase